MPADVLGGFEYPSPEVLECPYPFYRELRQQAPVYRLPTGEFVITRYADVTAAARNPALMSNFIGPYNHNLSRSYEDEGQPKESVTPYPVPFCDPPEHRLKRDLTLPIVSRERLLRYEPMIAGIADSLIDEFIGRGKCEFRTEFADRMPALVISRIIGIPEADDALLKAWFVNAEGVGGRMATHEQLDREVANRRLAREYFRKMILDRQREPTGDFVSELVAAKIKRDGDLDLAYLSGEVTNIYSAASATTAHMLASSMLLLLQHPHVLAAVTADRSLIPGMLEESMRVESPVQWLQRIATEDTEIAGVAIPKSSSVMLFWASGNRDEARFDNPEEFRIDREGLSRSQLAFGHGIHRCLGSPLARLEGRIAFGRLLDRLTDLRLAADNATSHGKSFNFRYPQEVRMEFTPTAQAGA